MRKSDGAQEGKAQIRDRQVPARAKPGKLFLARLAPPAGGARGPPFRLRTSAAVQLAFEFVEFILQARILANLLVDFRIACSTVV